jgi:hypothetical protein
MKINLGASAIWFNFHLLTNRPLSNSNESSYKKRPVVLCSVPLESLYVSVLILSLVSFHSEETSCKNLVLSKAVPSNPVVALASSAAFWVAWTYQAPFKISGSIYLTILIILLNTPLDLPVPGAPSIKTIFLY